MINRDEIKGRGVAWGLRPQTAIIFAVTAVAMAGFQCSKAVVTEQPDEAVTPVDEADGESESALVARSPLDGVRLSRARMAVRDSRVAANFIGRISPASTTETFESPQQITEIKNNTLTVAPLAVGLSRQKIGEDEVNLRTYQTNEGAQLVGPTLVLTPGNSLAVTLQNDLSPNVGEACTDNIGFRPPACGDPIVQGTATEMNNYQNFKTNWTNLHTHGLAVSPTGVSDNVLLNVCPGKSIDYKIDVPKDHHPGTFWYHAHKHGATAVQLASGMEGFIIIKGGLDNARGIKGAKDRQMMFQQIPYTKCAEWGPAVDCSTEQRTCTTPRNTGVVEFQQVLDNYDSDTCGQERRPTVINGVVQPTLVMKKGEVERWRFGHGGILQGLSIVLLSEQQYKQIESELAGGSETTWPTDTAPMHRVSLDGLATGKVQPMQTIELSPGNRADVMVKACGDKPGDDCMACEGDSCEFYMVDKEVLAGLKGWEPAALLATVRIEGKGKDMRLPTERDVLKACKPGSSCTPGSLADTTPDGHTEQVVFSEGFGNEDDPDALWPYNINKAQFQSCASRHPVLGTVADWFLTTSTDAPSNWNHPYHIHVNPFQLLKIWDDTNKEVTDDPDLGLFRDTLLVRRGWKYQVRTKYERFTGAFVFHCHILNHEDQGMMEIVEVVDKDGNVIGADGKPIPVSTSGGGHGH